MSLKISSPFAPDSRKVAWIACTNIPKKGLQDQAVYNWTKIPEGRPRGLRSCEEEAWVVIVTTECWNIQECRLSVEESYRQKTKTEGSRPKREGACAINGCTLEAEIASPRGAQKLASHSLNDGHRAAELCICFSPAGFQFCLATVFPCSCLFLSFRMRMTSFVLLCIERLWLFYFILQIEDCVASQKRLWTFQTVWEILQTMGTSIVGLNTFFITDWLWTFGSQGWNARVWIWSVFSYRLVFWNFSLGYGLRLQRL